MEATCAIATLDTKSHQTIEFVLVSTTMWSVPVLVNHGNILMCMHMSDFVNMQI